MYVGEQGCRNVYPLYIDMCALKCGSEELDSLARAYFPPPHGEVWLNIVLLNENAGISHLRCVLGGDACDAQQIRMSSQSKCDPIKTWELKDRLTVCLAIRKKLCVILK